MPLFIEYVTKFLSILFYHFLSNFMYPKHKSLMTKLLEHNLTCLVIFSRYIPPTLRRSDL